MNYEFSKIGLIYFISGLIALGVVFLLRNKRKKRGALFLLLSALSSAIWNFSNIFESSGTSVEIKLLWSQISYLGITTCVAFFFLFAIEYAQLNRFINRKTVLLVLLIPFLTIVLAATNPLHKLIWKDITISSSNNIGEYIYGWWFWLFIAYDYILLISAIIILFSGSIKFFIVHKMQFWLFILGSSLPFIANVLYVFKINPLTGLDITPISFTLTALIIAFSVFWLNLFIIMPIARKHIIDNLHDGVVVIDNMNRIIEVNPMFQVISNTSNDQLVGKPLEIIFPNIITINGISNEKEFLNETKIVVDGEIQYYEVRYYPIADSNNNLMGKILLLHDITLRKSAMKIAMESNRRLKNELIEKENLIYDLNACASSITYDLKNIISSQIDLTEKFKDVINKNNLKEAHIYFEKINSQGVRLMNILDDLQLLAKIRKEDINLTPVDMASIIDETFKQLEFNENLASISIIKPEVFPKVLGHQQLIEKVWKNLIRNAIKFGGKPVSVNIGFNNEGDSKTRFWIQDNGNGLPPDSLIKLFHDFERSEKNNLYGYDLGLSVVKKIIEKIGGKINVSSKNSPGEGCIFSFTLLNP